MFDVPTPQRPKITTIDGFLGVDNTSNDVDIRRSPNCDNFINDHGLIRKRNRYRYVDEGNIQPTLEFFIGKKILDVFNISGPTLSDDSVCTIYFIGNVDTSQKITVKIGANEYNYTIATADRTQDLYCKSIKFGQFMWCYIMKPLTNKIEKILRIKIENAVGNSTDVSAEPQGYVPTTSINRNPNGTSGVFNESPNRLTNRRKNSFTVSTPTTAFTLEKDINVDKTQPIVAKYLLPDGTYEQVTCTFGEANGNNNVFTSKTIGISPIFGMDNVEIEFSTTLLPKVWIGQSGFSDKFFYITDISLHSSSPLKYKVTVNPINGTDSLDTFAGADDFFYYNRTLKMYVAGSNPPTYYFEPLGFYTYLITGDAYNGLYQNSSLKQDSSIPFYSQPVENLAVYGYENNDRLFVNYKNSNVDWYSAPNNPLYFPADNFTAVGSDSPIVGYGVVNNRLITVKDDTNSIIVRQGMLLDSTEVFPSDSIYSSDKILKVISEDNRMFALTNTGVYELSIGNLVKFHKRSINIENYIKDIDMEKVDMTILDNKLYIKENKLDLTVQPDNRIGKMYIGYMDIKHKNKFEEDYQFEWYPCSNIPGGDFKILGIKEKKINILNPYVRYEYSNEYETGLSYDSRVSINATTYVRTVIDTTIQSYWETPFLNMGSIAFAKTIKNIYLNTRNKINDRFEFGYILPDGTTTVIDKIQETNNGGFPQLMSEKEKIKKFMWIKFYIKSIGTNNTTFDLLQLEWINGGKYRGE